MPFMKVFQWNNIVAGLLVLMFALILAVDALLVTWGQPGIPLSDNDVKGITGITFVIIAGFSNRSHSARFSVLDLGESL